MNEKYIQDLFIRRDKIKEEISIAKMKIETIQKTISEKGSLLLMLEDIIRQSSYNDDNEIDANEKEVDPTNTTCSEIIDFLMQKPDKSARTSWITDAIAKNNREKAQKVFNTLYYLNRKGKIQIIKEFDEYTGDLKTRNRLYQLIL